MVTVPCVISVLIIHSKCFTVSNWFKFLRHSLIKDKVATSFAGSSPTRPPLPRGPSRSLRTLGTSLLASMSYSSANKSAKIGAFQLNVNFWHSWPDIFSIKFRRIVRIIGKSLNNPNWKR